jgi:hypothetical protein
MLCYVWSELCISLTWGLLWTEPPGKGWRMEGDGFGDRHMFMQDLYLLSVEGSRDHGALETVKTKQTALEVRVVILGCEASSFSV